WAFIMTTLIATMITELLIEIKSGMLHVSPSTKKYQIRAVFSLLFQGLVPALVYVIPILCELAIYAYAVIVGYEVCTDNETASTISALLFSLIFTHTFAHSVTILACAPPYRKLIASFAYRIFTMELIPLIGGTLFAVLSVIGLLINFIVLYAILKGRLLFKGQSSSVYIFSFSSIAMDNLMIFIHVIYQIPAIYAQSWLFEGGWQAPPVVALSYVFMYCWYYTTLSHILISVTRLIAIVRWSSLTNGRAIALVVLTHSLSLGGAAFSQFFSPCCKLSFNYIVYSYVYETIHGTPNYSNDIIDLPFNTFSSVCSLACYTSIIVYMHWMGRAVSGEAAFKRRQQEYVYFVFISYAMQFAAMAAFYSISWLSFRILPPLVGNSPQVWLYGITMLFVLLNSWSNAFVYLVNNAEVS
ncbi:hypothetical protein PMAYCL1PPCAC_15381, partial [Pristionchus mayeri]